MEVAGGFSLGKRHSLPQLRPLLEVALDAALGREPRQRRSRRSSAAPLLSDPGVVDVARRLAADRSPAVEVGANDLLAAVARWPPGIETGGPPGLARSAGGDG